MKTLTEDLLDYLNSLTDESEEEIKLVVTQIIEVHRNRYNEEADSICL